VQDLARDELALARLDEARRAARAVACQASAAPAAVTDPSWGPLCIDIAGDPRAPGRGRDEDELPGAHLRRHGAADAAVTTP
jgi:hypothetical protein